MFFFFFFSSRRRHTRLQGDWSSDVCSSDLLFTYDNTSATNIANSLKVNSSVTAQQLPNTQAITVWGTPVASAIVITPGVNDTLNLNVDGTAWPTITLSTADTKTPKGGRGFVCEL